MRPQLSVVIPCLNEEETLEYVIGLAAEGLRQAGLQGEIIVADNGSTDRSQEIARQAGARIVTVTGRGYGLALAAGIRAAQAEYVIFADADGSYDLTVLGALYRRLAEGADLVIGSRLRGRIQPRAMPWLHRYLGTPLLTGLLNWLFRLGISDCNSGMRGLTRAAFVRMRMTASGMEFASEMVIKAGLLNLRLEEVPIDFAPDRRSRSPHLRTWRDGWRHLRFILLFAPDHLFIYPGSSLFLVGSLMTLIQAGGPVQVGRLYMDLHFMVFGVMLSVLGLAIYLMGVTIKRFSEQQSFYERDLVVRQWARFSFEQKLVLGLLALVIGSGIDILIVWDWVRADFADPGMLRSALLGFYFLSSGLLVVLFSFLEMVMTTGKPRTSL